MTMIVAVKPKAGRLASGAYAPISPIRGNPFPNRPLLSNAPVRQGGLAMDNSRVDTIYQNPNAPQYDTATGQPVIALQQVAADSTRLVPTKPVGGDKHSVGDIGPHERGKFFPTKIIPINKTQFGASNADKSNTAFHPVVSPTVPRSLPVSAIAVAATKHLPSFVSTNNTWSDPNNSFLGGKGNATGQGSGTGRWSTVKRSVV